MQLFFGRFNNRLISSSLVSVLVAAALTSCIKLPTITVPQQQAAPPKLIWSGESGGFRIRWTSGDITAQPSRAPARQSLSELAQTVAEFHLLARQQKTDCDLTRVAKLQSVAGSIVSIQSNDTMKCTNGAVATIRKTTAIDLTYPKNPVMLTDIFPAHELAAAQTKAKHFCASVPEDLMSSFAFSELYGHTVIAAITLPTDCNSAQFSYALNTPAKLQRALQLAAQQKEGFLSRNQRAISHNDSTTINYHYRTSVGP